MLLLAVCAALLCFAWRLLLPCRSPCQAARAERWSCGAINTRCAPCGTCGDFGQGYPAKFVSCFVKGRT